MVKFVFKLLCWTTLNRLVDPSFLFCADFADLPLRAQDAVSVRLGRKTASNGNADVGC